VRTITALATGSVPARLMFEVPGRVAGSHDPSAAAGHTVRNPGALASTPVTLRMTPGVPAGPAVNPMAVPPATRPEVRVSTRRTGLCATRALPAAVSNHPIRSITTSVCT